MKSCLACGSATLGPLVDLGTSPVLTGALWDDQASAQGARRGPMRLTVCQQCGHVANEAFDATVVEYDVAYDNSLEHSPTFRRFAAELARRLVQDRGVRGRHILEVGSGKGDFLEVMCQLGGNTGTGYDPTVQPDRHIPGVRLVADYFRPGRDVEWYDLLVCRHVLEHLDDPAAMLRNLRSTAPDGSLFYLEVPSAEFNFGPDGRWDCIYPHVSYFSAQSLDALVRRCGFEVAASGRAFGGQFLWVEAHPGSVDTTPAGGVEEHLDRLDGFRRQWEATVRAWREQIALRTSAGEQLALWGAGAKGVTFLNAVDPDGQLVVVDLNPGKWGRYLPGTGHRVGPPSSLAGRAVSAVVVTNPAYRAEISAQLADMGVQADVVSV